MGSRSLGEEREDLLDSSFAISTLDKYNAAWKLFMEFLLDFELEPDEYGLSLYVEHLFFDGLMASSISGHLSAIAYGLSIRGLPDVTKEFLILRMLKGIRKQRPTCDIRIPITDIHLHNLLDVLRRGVKDYYLSILYQTIFSWAWHACMRVSEYTEGNASDHGLKRQNIAGIRSGGQVTSYRVKFQSFKHCPQTFPDMIMIPSKDPSICPVRPMNIYLFMRGDQEGPLFIDHRGPITRKKVADNLRTCAGILGWNQDRIQTHSFRIGRASAWAEEGYSALQIRVKGRWFSNAFEKYLRTPVVLG